MKLLLEMFKDVNVKYSGFSKWLAVKCFIVLAVITVFHLIGVVSGSQYGFNWTEYFAIVLIIILSYFIGNFMVWYYMVKNSD